MDIEKRAVRDAVSRQRAELIALAHDIHQHPEAGFCETFAAARCTALLQSEGFAVRKGVCGMPTAFSATLGDGPLHVAFCAEYDALPPTSLTGGLKPAEVAQLWQTGAHDAPLRHACGHNLIAGTAVTAAIGLKDVARAIGLKVSVFGTPAEELIGLQDPPPGYLAPGKVRMLDGGAFDDVHAVLMIHPGATPYATIAPSKAGMRYSARFSKAKASDRGLDASAARELDGGLRRAVRPLKQAPYFCVVQPEGADTGARADIFYAGRTLDAVMDLRETLRGCFEQAARSAGVTVEITEYKPSADMRHDPRLSTAYRKNWEVLGQDREQDEEILEEADKLVPFGPRALKRLILGRMASHLYISRPPVEILWGTDLGNVSHTVPAIQPFLGVGGVAAVHSLEFAERADSEMAYRGMLDAGTALAWTALDAATEAPLRNYLLDRAAKRHSLAAGHN